MFEFFSTCRIDDTEMGLDVADTLCFQLGGDGLPGGNFVGHIAEHFGLVTEEGHYRLTVVVGDLRVIDMDELVRITRNEEEVYKLRQSIVGLCGVVDRSITDQSRFATWMISCMTQLMDASGRTYQAFDNTLVGSSEMPYMRCTRRRTDYAITSAPQQLDP
nr:hypothetical protein [Tanacetum cinerariifolium]